METTESEKGIPHQAARRPTSLGAGGGGGCAGDGPK